MLLRAKPAVVVVVSEVGAQVTLSCAGAEKTDQAGAVSGERPPASSSVRGAGSSPTRTSSSRGYRSAAPGSRAARREGVPRGLPARRAQRRSVAPGAQPRSRGAARRARAWPRAGRRVKLAPAVWVVLPNGMRLAARIAKYSPPPAGEAMSGRDLALLRVEAADLPTLPLGDSDASSRSATSSRSSASPAW